MKRRCIAWATATVMVLAPGFGEAKPKKDPAVIDIIESLTGTEIQTKKHKKQASRKDRNSLDSLDAIRSYILDYRKSGNKGLPPGLAKKDTRNLPPGWQKKVYPGAILPADLASFLQPLNYTAIPRFRPPKSSEEVYTLGNRILKLNRSDRKILDMLDLD